ncbi:MAG: acetate kinase, partial [Thermoleophilia bacterium]|nr:acetate kinase [Thermoleophilia bacterium]
GFTPLEGLVMGTRAGDIDPGILLYLLREGSYTVEQLDELLNRRSGLLGLSGCSNDVRVLLERAAAGDDAAQTALDVFAYRAKKYIGAYLAVLNGADALVFTGGIGEHAWKLRAQICSGLDNLGLCLDEQRNRSTIGVEGKISSAESQVDVWVIPTNEELLIAREAARLILRQKQG